ncbi:MAG: CRISPR-associated endonuclease Cas2 [Bacteroidetes bacterium]|nr:CRISPR-associated endonuclease Cas2 [Bacteroidota bacterium]
MPRYAIAYDIANNARRRKVANLLDSYGDRVQNSVFEMVVTKPMLEICLNRMKEFLDLKEDKVVVYFLCKVCESKRIYIGDVEDTPSIGEEQVFIV